MQCKFLKGTVENLGMRYSLKKLAGKKGVGGEVFIKPLDETHSTDFPKVCGEPLGCIRPLTGFVQGP